MESEARMNPQVTPLEAAAALDAVERGRRRVVDEIDLPAWYWWGLAIGWIALGYLSDLNHPWVTAAATLAFGAVHSSVAARVTDGRHRSNRLTVGRDVAGRHVARLVIGSLLVLVVVTIAAALAANADGARHPATAASILVAVIIVLGGPRLLEGVRRRAARTAATA
jgi:hypothetical protein